jgi:hypothetical protein
MKSSRSLLCWCLSLCCGALICAFALSPTRAQDAPQDESKITPTTADQTAADQATIVYRHARPANTPAGSKFKQQDLIARHRSSSAPATASSTTDNNDQLRYPADLTYFGGPVIDAAESHAIYLLPKNGSCNKISPCWGNPERFLNDMSGSDFVHLIDQYIGVAAGHRYTVGAHASVTYTPTPKTKPLTDANIAAIVHAVALKTALSGYGHIYHVFLPPGQDVCLPSSPSDPDDAVCYSPDVPTNFAFCAYHNSATFQDSVGHVLYTVEPFQHVSGCSVRPGTPNGQLADSTYNSLSHETIEAITDPDGSAWFNFTDVGLAGEEIGDECAFFVFTNTGMVFYDPSLVMLGSHKYAIQPEYSNSEHACASAP